ncbi:MAG: septum formation protein Maf [Elusimicrobiaceae bacterium]|nr:septum formation protein Maf [Elusimicrobiaceae bacterium]
MKLVLASRSPRRIELLRQLGKKFVISPSEKAEVTRYKRPHLQVLDLSAQKALTVAQKYPQALVIGADTLVYCGGEVIGKPKDEKDALRILRKLNGTWQSVYTGVTLVHLALGKCVRGVAKTRCKARKLPLAQLQKLAGKHLDKAGGYAVQDEDDLFIEKIQGSRSNVVGFPVELFTEMMKEFEK